MSGQPLSQPYRWVKSGTAILSFSLGTYVFSRLCRFFGPLRRSTLCGSFILQALFCFVSGILVVSNVVPSDAGNQLPNNYIVLLPLSLLSFQSAGQIVASRMLAYNELPTVVLTSTYCDLMFDPALFTAPITQNPKRNRRFISAVALLLGAMLGGMRSGCSSELRTQTHCKELLKGFECPNHASHCPSQAELHTAPYTKFH